MLGVEHPNGRTRASGPDSDTPSFRHVLPDHSAPGDGSLVAAERTFIADLRSRALALKQQGVAADEAGTRLTTAFSAKYPDWPRMNVGGFVQRIYAEGQ